MTAGEPESKTYCGSCSESSQTITRKWWDFCCWFSRMVPPQFPTGFLASLHHIEDKETQMVKSCPSYSPPPPKSVIKLLQLNAVPSTLALVPHRPSSLTFCSGVAQVLFPTEMYARCTANTCRNSQNLEIPTILEDSFKKPKILQPTAAIQLTLQNSILYDSFGYSRLHSISKYR